MLGSYLALSSKSEHVLILEPNNSTLGDIYQRSSCTFAPDDRHKNVHSSTVCHGSILETTQLSLNRRMDKAMYIQTVEYYAAMEKNKL